MMQRTIKDVFDERCKDLIVDSKLIKLLQMYDTNFTTANQDHIQFFGGNLTGVQVVRFMDQNRDSWFHDILKINEGPLTDELLELPTVDVNHKVASDTMNLSCVWLAHSILNEKGLTPDQKHLGAVTVFKILQYKFITSRLFRHFKYQASQATAEATYAQLSYKFDIKRYGNWSAVITARAEDIVRVKPTPSIHLNTILKMDNDDKVQYVLSDTQGRIRSMLKGIYDIFLQVHNQGIRITSTSSIIEHDGEAMLKDKTKSALAYERYLTSIITDKNSFIREELTTIIEKIMYTMPPRVFIETLEWMSKNFRQSGAGEIEIVLNETIIHSLDYFNHHRDLIRNTSDLPELLGRLRGVYTSSRSTDAALFSLREKMEIVIKKATGNKNDSTIASVRTGVLLYIVLRTMTMRHYSH
jgi:hypothetical protein